MGSEGPEYGEGQVSHDLVGEREEQGHLEVMAEREEWKVPKAASEQW